MSVYLVIEFAIDDGEGYAEYVRRVPDTLLPHGARYLARGGAVWPLSGDWHPERMVVIEFPSRGHFERWVHSPAYAAIAPLREHAAGTRSILLDGFEHSRPALVPEFYVRNLERSLSFYLDGLGFAVDYARPEEGFAAIYLGSAHLMLEQARDLQQATPEDLARGHYRTADLQAPFGRGLNVEIQVGDLDGIHRRLLAHGDGALLAPHARSYRVRDLTLDVRQMLVADPDGYLLRLSERQRFRASP